MRPDPTAGRLRQLLLRVVTVAGLAGITAAAWAVPATAHTDLIASSPSQGDRVALSTDRLVLDFGEDLLAAANDVAVRGPDGDDAVVGEPGLLGSTLDVPLHLTAPGRYTVAYRVMGQDGHLVTGTLWFTATTDGLPLPDAVAASRGRLSGAAADAAPEGAASAAATSPLLRWGLPGLGLVALLLVLHSSGRGSRRRGSRS